MPTKEKPIRPLTWVLISGGGFLLFLALAFVFGIYSDRFASLSTPVYFFLVVIIGLIAAGFLFGALRSHAKYTGKVYNGTLEMGGPVVALALVILLGYQFRPTEHSFTTTVNLFSQDSSRSAIDKGKLTMYYGSARLTKEISEGQVVIHEIPIELRGKEVTFLPSVEGYDQQAQKVRMPATDGVVNLYLHPIPDSVTVTGIVLNKGGKTIVKNATVVFADGIAKAITDVYGNFKTRLPVKDGAEVPLRVYENERLRYNTLIRISDKAPLTIQLD